MHFNAPTAQTLPESPALKLSCSCGQPRRVRAICCVAVMPQLGVLLLGFAP